MHPNMDDLLALRDGDGSAETVRHVEQCPQCSAAVEDLLATANALRELPRLGSERDHWPEIRRRVVEQRRRRLVVRIGAAAASVIVVVTTAVLIKTPVATPVPETAQADARVVVDELAAASRGLEAVLRDPGLRRQVLSPRRAAVIVDLEDRIAAVDMALADQPIEWGVEQNVALWSHRVELLDALVTARTGDLGEKGVSYAVIQHEGSQP